MAVNPTPTGYHSITPSVVVDNAAKALTFYRDALGAKELYRLPIGDKIEFIVGYSDTTVHLHEEIVGVRGGRVESIWRVAGRGKIK